MVIDLLPIRQRLTDKCENLAFNAKMKGIEPGRYLKGTAMIMFCTFAASHDFNASASVTGRIAAGSASGIKEIPLYPFIFSSIECLKQIDISVALQMINYLRAKLYEAK